MLKAEKQKMLAGELYDAGDAEIQADLAAMREWLVRYNASLAMPSDERRGSLAERLAAVGTGSIVRPPFNCDYGFNLTLGSGVFLNFGCVVLDVVGSRALRWATMLSSGPAAWSHVTSPRGPL